MFEDTDTPSPDQKAVCNPLQQKHGRKSAEKEVTLKLHNHVRYTVKFAMYLQLKTNKR